jgi:hypothetical protein
MGIQEWPTLIVPRWITMAALGDDVLNNRLRAMT